MSMDIFSKTVQRLTGRRKNCWRMPKNFVYEKSCLECHQNLFPVKLSVDGSNAHLFYTTSKEPLACINCHLNVGHYDKNALHAHNTSFGVTVAEDQTLFTEPAKVEKFENFNEKIPGTNVSFDMVALPGGKFQMGSPDDEPFRETRMKVRCGKLPCQNSGWQKLKLHGMNTWHSSGLQVRREELKDR